MLLSYFFSQIAVGMYPPKLDVADTSQIRLSIAFVIRIGYVGYAARIIKQFVYH